MLTSSVQPSTLNFSYNGLAKSCKGSLTAVAGSSAGFETVKPFKGGQITSNVILKASFNILGTNYFNNQLDSSRQGFVLTSISQGRRNQSTIKSQPSISKQKRLLFLFIFSRELTKESSITGKIFSLTSSAKFTPVISFTKGQSAITYCCLGV